METWWAWIVHLCSVCDKHDAVQIINNFSLWRHQMQTFSALLALCAGNSPVTGDLHSHRPVTRSFDVFFDLRPNTRLSKQSRNRWFETPLFSLLHNCNETDSDTALWDVKKISATSDIFYTSCVDQGAVSIRKTVFPGMAIPMLKIRRPNGRLIFNMEIAIRR